MLVSVWCEGEGETKDRRRGLGETGTRSRVRDCAHNPATVKIAVRTSFWLKDVRRRQSRGIGYKGSQSWISIKISRYLDKVNTSKGLDGQARDGTHQGEDDEIEKNVHSTAREKESINVDAMSRVASIPEEMDGSTVAIRSLTLGLSAEVPTIGIGKQDPRR